MKIDWKRSIVFATGLVAGACASLLKCMLITDVSKVAELMVTIFAVLAGFLVASLTFILSANPVKFRSKTATDQYKLLLLRRMRRQMWTFFCYITVLLCIIISVLLKSKFPSTASLLERVYIGLGLASIIWSYTLPATLIGLQKEKAYFAKQEIDR